MVTVLEILKYVVPSVVSITGAYLIVQKFLVTETKRKELAIFEHTQDTTLRFKLQAYERLALFLERINSLQLLSRLYDTDMTVAELQFAMITTVKNEFEHNLSQQIYVSKNVWETVKGVKEQELNMINRVCQMLDPNAPARELYARIMELISRTESELPTQVGLQVLNAEAKMVMQYGTY